MNELVCKTCNGVGPIRICVFYRTQTDSSVLQAYTCDADTKAYLLHCIIHQIYFTHNLAATQQREKMLCDSLKSKLPICCHNIIEADRFSKFFTAMFGGKLATNLSMKIPTHFKPLLYLEKILMSENQHSCVLQQCIGRKTRGRRIQRRHNFSRELKNCRFMCILSNKCGQK